MPNIGDVIRAEDLEAILEQINNSSSNIIGELKYFGFSEVPEHCLMCDGSAISRETYSELFAKYGTTYGEGDGSTTFNLPDYRGAFFRCIGGNADSIGVLQGDAIREITGDIDGTFDFSVGNGAFYLDNVAVGVQAINVNARGHHAIRMRVSRVVPTAVENRPINFAVNVCVVYE